MKPSIFVFLTVIIFLSQNLFAKENWEGSWAPNSKICKSKPMTDDPNFNIWKINSKTFFNGEKNCKVAKFSKKKEVVTLDLNCMMEGEPTKDTVTFTTKGNQLISGDGNVTLVRCGYK